MQQDKVLKRWPRVIGHLIAESYGYFTPRDAANAIVAYKLGKPFWCEWYLAITSPYLPGKPKQEVIVEVGRLVLREAIRKRHFHKGFMNSYGAAKIVVMNAQEGRNPTFASWF